jgi:hypothetical protein
MHRARRVCFRAMAELRGTFAALAIFACACSSNSSSSGDAGAGGDGSTATTNDWSCLGHVTLPAATKSTLALKFIPVDPQTSVHVSGVAVKACAADDAACANPVATTTSDSSGVATLSVPAAASGFGGYWSGTIAGDLENLNFTSVPYLDDVRLFTRLQWTNAEMTLLLQSSGVTWDRTRGVVGVQALDCGGVGLDQSTTNPHPSPTAAGVRFTIDVNDPQIVLGYVNGPSISKTVTQTDSTGLAGFINVPPGVATVTGTRVSTGEKIASVRVYVKAGALSNITLNPAP